MADGSEAVAPPNEQVRLAEPAGKWVLAAMVLGSGMASLDATVVNVALPRLGDDLHADFAGLQWVLTGYTLTLASLILVGGALGDRLGRRRVFLVGVVWFALASLLCGAAPNLTTLVAARMLQGIGGALLTPGSLAIIQASFHPEDRAKAIGAWSGLGGITTAVGPFFGGWLVAVASWRWIFLLNLPLAALVISVGLRHVPESRDPTVTGRLDYPGVVLGASGLAATTYGLIDKNALVAAVGIIALVAFLVAEARQRHPMMPLAAFRSRQFSAANAVTFVLYAALGMVLFLVGLVLQRSLGYSPLAAGASLFPITVIMLVFSARSGALAQRIGPRLPMTIGPAVVGVGLLLMNRVQQGAGYATSVLPAVVVFGCGLALTVAPLTATVLAAADARHSGIASGVNNAIARVGGLLAVASVPVLTGFDPARTVSAQTLVDGFHATATIAALMAFGAALLAWATIRSDVLAAATIRPGVPAGKEPGAGSDAQPEPCFTCGVNGPPLVAYATAATGDGRAQARSAKPEP